MGCNETWSVNQEADAEQTWCSVELEGFTENVDYIGLFMHMQSCIFNLSYAYMHMSLHISCFWIASPSLSPFNFLIHSIFFRLSSIVSFCFLFTLQYNTVFPFYFLSFTSPVSVFLFLSLFSLMRHLNGGGGVSHHTSVRPFNILVNTLPFKGLKSVRFF